MNPNSKRTLIVLAVGLLAALGIFVRTYGLSEWRIGGDDMLRLAFLSEKSGVLDVIASVQRETAHPALLYVILHVLMKLGGDPMTLRLCALVPGTLLIPVWFVVGRRVGGGLAAAFFLAVVAAFGHELVVQSQTLKSYALFLVFQGLMIATLVKPGESWDRPVPWAYFGLAAAWLVTHYNAPIFILTTGLTFLPIRWRALGAAGARNWLLLHLPLAALFLVQAWLYQRGYKATIILRSGLDVGAADATNTVLDLFHRLPFAKSAPVPLLLLAPFGLGAVALAWTRRFDILALSLLPLVITLALSLGGQYPFSANRHGLHMMLPVLLPCCVGLQTIADRLDRRLAAVLLLVFFGLLAWNFDHDRVSIREPDSYRRDDMDGRWEDYRAALKVVNRGLAANEKAWAFMKLKHIAMLRAESELWNEPEVSRLVGFGRLGAMNAAPTLDFRAITVKQEELTGWRHGVADYTREDLKRVREIWILGRGGEPAGRRIRKEWFADLIENELIAGEMVVFSLSRDAAHAEWVRLGKPRLSRSR